MRFWPLGLVVLVCHLIRNYLAMFKYVQICVNMCKYRALLVLSGPSGNRRAGPSGSIGPFRKQKYPSGSIGPFRKLKVRPFRIYRALPETEERALPDLSGPSGNRRSGPSGSVGPFQKQKSGPFWIYGALPETEERALPDICIHK